MPYYRVLSCPIVKKAPLGYKGIYRCEPDYQESDGKEIHDLWYRYVEYAERGSIVGVTDELSRDELVYFSKLLSIKRGIEYEVVCIDKERNNLVGSLYYGMDVSSPGGYSMIGEGFFCEKHESNNSEEIKRINRFFETKLNRYGLFSSEEDAQLFLNTLSDMRRNNLVEKEDSFIFHISHVSNSI